MEETNQQEQYSGLGATWAHGILPKIKRFAMDEVVEDGDLNRLKNLLLKGEVTPSLTIDREASGIHWNPTTSKFNVSVNPQSVYLGYDSNANVKALEPGLSPEDSVTNALLKYQLQEKPNIINGLNPGGAVELGLQAASGGRSNPFLGGGF